MTSKVVEIRNALNAIIEAALPSYVKLSDSIDHQDNTNLALQKGFRVGYGSADNITQNWCNNAIMRRRQFSFALTNLYIANLDAEQREETEDSLLEDQNTVILAITRDPELGGVASNSTYAFDTGVEYLVDSEGQKQYILTVATIAVDYEEGV